MFIRVFVIPEFTGTFHFHEPEACIFWEIDWFDDTTDLVSTPEGMEKLKGFIKSKSWFDENRAYLVLHPTHTFTIGYKEP